MCSRGLKQDFQDRASDVFRQSFYLLRRNASRTIRNDRATYRDEAINRFTRAVLSGSAEIGDCVTFANNAYRDVNGGADAFRALGLVCRTRSDEEGVGAVNCRFRYRVICRVSAFCYAFVFVLAALVRTQRYVVRVYDVEVAKLPNYASVFVFNLYVYREDRSTFSYSVLAGLRDAQRFKYDVPALSATPLFCGEGVFLQVQIFCIFERLATYRLRVGMVPFGVGAGCQAIQFHRRPNADFNDYLGRQCNEEERH